MPPRPIIWAKNSSAKAQRAMIRARQMCPTFGSSIATRHSRRSCKRRCSRLCRKSLNDLILIRINTNPLYCIRHTHFLGWCRHVPNGNFQCRHEQVYPWQVLRFQFSNFECISTQNTIRVKKHHDTQLNSENFQSLLLFWIHVHRINVVMAHWATSILVIWK